MDPPLDDPMDPALLTLAEPLREALLARGIRTLTPVQRALTTLSIEGKNLRITAQTGSGKTVAFGLAVASCLAGSPAPGAPFVLILEPTRELAAQVREELSWLYARLSVGLATLTGGGSSGLERIALAKAPSVVVGTPGRTLEHLRSGALSFEHLRAVVFDEAAQLLEVGFRDELYQLLQAMPDTRRTHLVSATFPDELRALGDRSQGSFLSVSGGPLGQANAHIDHVIHVVHDHERRAALVNLLLSHGDEKALVFVRTRKDVEDLAAALAGRGFAAAPLTGELEQRARTRTLEAFRTGEVRVLVATDLASRGLDIAELSLVIHFDAPDNSEPYTHRAGRTGRGGQRGTSITLVAPKFRERPQRVMSELGIFARWLPPPDAAAVGAAQRLRIERACRDAVADLPAALGERAEALGSLAEKLLEEHEPRAVVAWLLAYAGRAGPCAPETVTPVRSRRRGA